MKNKSQAALPADTYLSEVSAITRVAELHQILNRKTADEQNASRSIIARNALHQLYDDAQEGIHQEEVGSSTHIVEDSVYPVANTCECVRVLRARLKPQI